MPYAVQWVELLHGLISDHTVYGTRISECGVGVGGWKRMSKLRVWGLNLSLQMWKRSGVKISMESSCR